MGEQEEESFFRSVSSSFFPEQSTFLQVPVCLGHQTLHSLAFGCWPPGSSVFSLGMEGRSLSLFLGFWLLGLSHAAYKIL